MCRYEDLSMALEKMFICFITGTDNRNGGIPPSPSEIKRSTNPFDDDRPIGIALQPGQSASIHPQPMHDSQQGNGFVPVQPMSRGQPGGIQLQPVTVARS
uniref:Uncharacterized protein n=1 Tax=Setaria viridis TaxID=4556 RepID=A0A4U6VLH7_SETVI|nr:hypothetical protein SEVIR_3G325703v2 [Setaria viridis]